MDGARAAPAISLPDGGALAEGVLNELPADTWKDFEDEFLAAEA